MARIGRAFPARPIIKRAVPQAVVSGSTWKTSIALATASIKTVNGLVLASIKANDGLTP